MDRRHLRRILALGYALSRYGAAAVSNYSLTDARRGARLLYRYPALLTDGIRRAGIGAAGWVAGRDYDRLRSRV